jgi:hypothetical protein
LVESLKRSPRISGFRHAVGADRRAHRPIDDGDAALEDLFKGMLGGFHHVFLAPGPIEKRVGILASLSLDVPEAKTHLPQDTGSRL